MHKPTLTRRSISSQVCSHSDSIRTWLENRRMHILTWQHLFFLVLVLKGILFKLYLSQLIQWSWKALICWCWKTHWNFSHRKMRAKYFIKTCLKQMRTDKSYFNRSNIRKLEIEKKKKQHANWSRLIFLKLHYNINIIIITYINAYF